MTIQCSPAEHMFQHKIDMIFKEIGTVFCIVDDILIVDYDADGKDHGKMLIQVMQIYYKENLKTKQKEMSLEVY